MTKAVFVGDKPSNTNVNDRVAFVGAKCFNRLVDWIVHIAPDYYVVTNSETEEDMHVITDLIESGFRAVALGREAAKRLDKYGLPYYELPHPSGANMKINNIIELRQTLDQAKEYTRVKLPC